MSISKMTIRDVDLKRKRVLMRVDFNVPISSGIIRDNTRIRAAVPTIRAVLEKGAGNIVLMSHLGDPAKDLKKARETASGLDEKKFIEKNYSLLPAARELSKLLGMNVKSAPSALGAETAKLVNSLDNGEILLLENTRLHPEETSKVPEEREKMGKELARYGDVFVNDAFGSAHRAHASTEAVAHYLPAVAGLLMERELEFLEEKIMREPARPFIAVIAGAKVSSKLGVLKNLLNKVDGLIIGGSMAYTFLQAKGLSVGASLVENTMLEEARSILKEGLEKNVSVYLPIDHIVAKEMKPDAQTLHVGRGSIEGDWKGMDIGPLSVEKFRAVLKGAGTVFWNGPVGVFEIPQFSKGTFELARIIADLPDCITVIGGGDSAAAVNQSGLADRMSHISTGGGAALELIEGRTLPGVAALMDKA